MIDVMARKVSVVTTDDLDGSPDAGTVSFGLDGVSYEIDLVPANRIRLADAVAPYIAAGRKVSRGPPWARASAGRRWTCRSRGCPGLGPGSGIGGLRARPDQPRSCASTKPPTNTLPASRPRILSRIDCRLRSVRATTAAIATYRRICNRISCMIRLDCCAQIVQFG